jgi:hypothetical protein
MVVMVVMMMADRPRSLTACSYHEAKLRRNL